MPQANPPGSNWLQQLGSVSAAPGPEESIRFADTPTELAALAAGVTVHPLLEVALIRAAGADAQAFLQSQLSNDVSRLDQPRAQLSTYCTAQGRMLASLLVWREGEAFMLALARSLADEVRQRLQRYVLRSKVKLEDVSTAYAVIGLGGTGAAATLATVCGPAPADAMARVSTPAGSAIRLSDDLFVIVAPLEQAPALWDRLSRVATAVGSEGWAWRMIRARLPTITAATRELFIPQMCDFDRLGAISFEKGCYPGQEIVARAHYRGEVKRRLHLLHADAGVAKPGQEVFRAGGTACGAVVNAAAAPQGGIDLLAVVLTEAADSAELRLGAPDGSALQVCR